MFQKCKNYHDLNQSLLYPAYFSGTYYYDKRFSEQKQSLLKITNEKVYNIIKLLITYGIFEIINHTKIVCFS